MKHQTPSVLFICKQRPARYGASYGLLNSCRFLCNALHDMGAEATLVEVVDNNGIDKEIHKYKPTHVFIEALWVVPEKFDVLILLHPTVQWHVRLHSNTPFIANEGMAIEWIVKYSNLQKKYPQFHISPNSERMINDLKYSLCINSTYSPNIYRPTEEVVDTHTNTNEPSNIINISSFGAVRPLKNQLLQAMAAIAFANQLGKTLHFHINSTRVEQKGDPVYKNIQALFNGNKHQIIEHEWLSHDEFITLILKMDLGMQVSFTETFNFVAADHVNNNIPVVGSKEIKWMNPLYQAKTTDLDNIVFHLWLAWIGKKINLHIVNKWGLKYYNAKSRLVWKRMLGL